MKRKSDNTIKKIFLYKFGKDYVHVLHQKTRVDKSIIKSWVEKDLIQDRYINQIHSLIDLYRYQVEYISARTAYNKGFKDYIDDNLLEGEFLHNYFDCAKLMELYVNGRIDAASGEDIGDIDFRKPDWETDNKGWYFNLFKGQKTLKK